MNFKSDHLVSCSYYNVINQAIRINPFRFAVLINDNFIN